MFTGSPTGSVCSPPHTAHFTRRAVAPAHCIAPSKTRRYASTTTTRVQQSFAAADSECCSPAEWHFFVLHQASHVQKLHGSHYIGQVDTILQSVQSCTGLWHHLLTASPWHFFRRRRPFGGDPGDQDEDFGVPGGNDGDNGSRGGGGGDWGSNGEEEGGYFGDIMGALWLWRALCVCSVLQVSFSHKFHKETSVLSFRLVQHQAVHSVSLFTSSVDELTLPKYVFQTLVLIKQLGQGSLA